ncbi:MAG: LPXTG cell wall anchor domain-containing protein [Acutalibacteraceae bacterium]|nr:LPXTG cell wall anchor domain-containing protein [Acutalibacteraceae bacterium]
MKKLTSVLMAGMLAATGCICAVTASATDETKATITVVDASGGESVTCEANVGDKIECTVTGYSDKSVTALLGSTYFNQVDADNLVEYSDIDVLGYSDGYYTETGLFYDTGIFSTMAVRPEDSSEYDRDAFGYCYILGRPAGDYAAENGQVIVKFALDVKAAGECTIKTVLEDVTYDDVNGEIVSDTSAVKTKTTVNVISTGEDSTEATEATEATDATEATETTEATEATVPTEATEATEVTAPSTEAPTNATNATTAIVATNATSSTTATSATNATSKSSTSTSTSNTTSSTTGKVATGDSTSVALVLAVLLVASGVFVVARRKING